MRKINVGAGTSWREEGWEVLDNGVGDYREPWKHRGKAWDSALPAGVYDVLFTSHMLEHVPHFRVEKTIAEFNRILKGGGRIRILVPSLKKYATAYVNGDASYFTGSDHESGHLGIGGSFVRKLISPGGQTLAISREMDEIIGGYAHLYSYDFDMLRILLEKWGFGKVTESEPGESALEELRALQHMVIGSTSYDMDDPLVRAGAFRRSGTPWHVAGFDKSSNQQLAVEAVKVRDEPYALSKEFEYNRRARFDGPVERMKLGAYRAVSRGIDIAYAAARRSGLNRILRSLR